MDRMIIFCLTTLCGTFVGIYFSLKLRDRYLLLTELNAIVLRMMGLLKYNRCTVCELLKRSKSEKLLFITDEMVRLSEEGKKIDKLWKKEIEKIKYLTTDDVRVISMLGQNLGTTETESQLAVMESVRCSLDILIKEADEIRKNKVRLYRTLGILLGAAVGIVIL